MIKKEFEHEKIETCRLCKKQIDTDTDNWNVLIDYSGKNQRVIGFTHVRCLTDLIKGEGKIIAEKFQNRLMGFVKGIFGGNTQNEVPQEDEFIEC